MPPFFDIEGFLLSEILDVDAFSIEVVEASYWAVGAPAEVEVPLYIN